MAPNSENNEISKAEIRASLRRAREEITPDQAALADQRRTSLILARLRDLRPSVVCCYVSAEPEPGTGDLLAELLDRGTRLLLPQLSAGVRAPAWAWWAGEPMVTGWRGIPCPPGPALPAETLAQADLIILPGLAGTPSGARLGQGGGWYDRALPYSRENAERWLLLNNSEILDRLPEDEHDQRVSHLVAQSGWIACHTSQR